MGPLKMLPLGTQQILAAGLSAAVGLTVPNGTNMAVLSIAGDSGDSVNWRDFGNPTDAIGINIAGGQPPYEYWGNVAALKFIIATGTPILNVSYYKIAG